MVKAILVEETGGPEVMVWGDVELPEIGPGQAKIHHNFAGFNMIDTYMRKGLYTGQLPFVPGLEAAGVVEAVAEDVTYIQPGDRVVYAIPQPGAYCVQRVLDARHLIRLPADISAETAAAGFLKGLTAWALLFRVSKLTEGNTILVYAAAGGVGSILCQWAKTLPIRIIGVVGSADKVVIARENGCDEVINYNETDIAAAVRELTGGAGVDVVYDSLGQATFNASLDSLKRCGLMVSYGNATGPVPPVNILELMRKGSLFLTRPQFFDYVPIRAALEEGANALFSAIRSGAVRININQRYPLTDAAQAHLAVESRQTTGSTVLVCMEE